MCAWRNTETRSGEESAERRCLSLLLEGATLHQILLDESAYRRFRSSILRDTLRFKDQQSDAELLSLVGSVVQEFANYRTEVQGILELRQTEWRQLANQLMRQLAERDAANLKSELWTSISLDLASAISADEILSLRTRLLEIFERSGTESALRRTKESEEQDRSTANDNAAGLRGGGAAIEHVRSMLAGSRPGFVGLFRLSCLDVVGERFGAEGIQDCLMAVSACLIQNMRAEDTVYHWSETSLLAVCDRKVSEEILAAEFNRVLARNREFTIMIGQRAIMLRIPVELELFPINQFPSAEALLEIGAMRRGLDRNADRNADRSPGRGFTDRRNLR